MGEATDTNSIFDIITNVTADKIENQEIISNTVKENKIDIGQSDP